MSTVLDWAKDAIAHKKFMASNNLHMKPQITHTVSKSFKGEYKQDRIFTQCKAPEASRHLHFPGTFDCELFSGKCDSEFSRKHINGLVKSRFDATFGHDDPFDKEHLHLNRGYFDGDFGLKRGAGRPYLIGFMSGLCNVGLNRDPFEKHYEDCHRVGRWYGLVQAGVELEGGERAFLTASLALEVQYKTDPSWLGVNYIGNLEGMLIRECKEAG